MKVRLYKTQERWNYFRARVNRSYEYFCMYLFTIELLILWGERSKNFV